MKKRVLSLFLAFTLSLSLLPSSVALAEESLNENPSTTQEETLGENPSTTQQETQGETMPSTPPTSENALGETTPSTATQSAINQENGIALLSSTPAGEGTKASPYLISSAEELAWFRDQVNDGNNEICARLTADIDLQNQEWEPIGNDEYTCKYMGTFDGSYHKISNINLATSGETSSKYKGLFGYIGYYANYDDNITKLGIVKRLTVEAGTLSGLSSSGLLAFVNEGEISLCYAHIREIGNNVSELGILVCSNSGTIENCLSSIDDSNKSSATGISGLVYTSTSKIDNCYFHGPSLNYSTNYAIVQKDVNNATENCYYYSYPTTNTYKDNDNTNIVAKYFNKDNGKEVIWLLNNGKNGNGNKISPWRYNARMPKLDPTLPAVTKDADGNFIVGDKPHIHTDDNGEPIEFTEISTLSEINNNNDTNYFCLKGDIELNSTWTAPERDIVLCMNGHTITQATSFNGTAAIDTNDDRNSKLTLTNCDNSNSGSIKGFDIGINDRSWLHLSGNLTITENDKNILIASSMYIYLKDLTKNAKFGISAENQDTLDENGSTSVCDKMSAQYLSNLYADGYNDNATGFDLFIDDNQYIKLRRQTPHKHCICGGEIKNEGHNEHETTDTIFLPWKETNSLPPSGNYYLTRNVELTTQWTPSGTINICLNGFSITTIDVTSQLNLTYIDLDQADDILTLTDCNTEKKQGTISFIYNGHLSKHAIRLSGGATFNLYGGTIKDFNLHAVDILSTAGHFNMYGGTLTGNNGEKGATFGGAVTCIGTDTDFPTFAMYGGKITGNTTYNSASGNNGGSGGGVYIGQNATFTMAGGEITDNTAYENGGGVYIAENAKSYSISNATITGNTAGANGMGGGIYAYVDGTISNSKIFNNQAKSGGGIHSRGVLTIDKSEIYNNTTIADDSTAGNIVNAQGGGIYSNNSLTISNTTISGNTATGKDTREGNGGGIYANSTTTFNDGTIIQNNTASTAAGGVYRSVSKPLSIAGKIKITDNTASGAKSNLYFSNVDTGNNNNYPILITKKLNEESSIGVTVNGITDTDAMNIATVDGGSGGLLDWLNKDYFTSDNSDYITLMSENNKFIQLGKHRHNWKYDYSADYSTVSIECTETDTCDNINGGTLTINKPKLKTYGDTAEAKATLTATNWQGESADSLAANITYSVYNTADTLPTPPTDAGKYTARVQVGDRGIYVDYMIKPKELTVTGISATDKRYDGTTNAHIETSDSTKLDGVLDSDSGKVDIDLTPAVSMFVDKNTGNDKTVMIKGAKLTGDAASNYKLKDPLTTTANITQREFYFKSITIEDKDYDTTDAATIGSIEYGNIIAGDDISMDLTARFESPDAGEEKTVLLSGGTLLGKDAGNYKRNYPLPTNCTATIRKATPTGAPKYTAITESGKTISGAALTTEGGTFNVPGTVAWVDDNSNPLPGSTIVETGKLYKWLFTPTDSNNYNTLSGSIELYHKQDSGSTGGGTTGGGGSTSGGGAIGGGGSTGGGSTGGGTQYTIDVIKGAHGSSSSGDISVSQGNDHTFTFTPNKGYTIFDVKIDGKSIGAVDTYTFENIDTNHTIEVIFVKSPTHQIAIPILGRFTQYYLQSMIHNLYRNIIFLHRLSA